MSVKRLFFNSLLLLFIVSSCTLSGEQEEQLNKQLGNYLAAHNENRLLESIGLTHPAVVSYYKAKGDSLFVSHFINDETTGTSLSDPIYKDMKISGRFIQRRYELESTSEIAQTSTTSDLFALSDDHGNNWFFIREADYSNTSIKGFKRLFK